MRLVSWNVCDGFKTKFGHLERLQPDIAVIQEVRPECLKYAGLQDRSIWIGQPGQKGLAVISYGDWKLSAGPADVSERWFLPVYATNKTTKIRLVGVWVNSPNDYVTPTLSLLEHLRTFVSGAPSIVAGDFNQSVVFDKNKMPGMRFADVLTVLNFLGLESAWHTLHHEKQGQETSPTLYWRWNPEQKYHIDFVFGSSDLHASDVALGSYEQYVLGKISDHVPLTVDYRRP